MKIKVWVLSASHEPFVTTVEAEVIAAMANEAPGSVVMTSHEIEVTLKPLEWEDYRDGAAISGRSQRRIAERAITPFRTYFLEEDTDTGSWWAVEGLLGDEIGGPFDSYWKARSALESDFTRAVASLLVGAER